MPFKFDIEGPETKAENELRRKIADLTIRKLAADPQTMDPVSRANIVDQEQAIYNDPNTTPGRRAVAGQRMMDYGGSVSVPGLGNIPASTTAEAIDTAMAAKFESIGQRLAYANQKIAEANASGNPQLAQALVVARDAMYSSAKDNFKKLPIKEINDLSEYKSLVDLGKTAIDSITGEELYGPVRGRINPLIASTSGYPDYTKMMQAFSGVNNQILKARSGGAVTDDEAKRFQAEIGDPTANDFPDRMKAFTAQRKREYMTKLQAFRDSGFEIPDSLLPDDIRQIISENKKSSSQPKQSQQQVIQTTIDKNGRIVLPQ